MTSAETDQTEERKPLLSRISLFIIATIAALATILVNIGDIIDKGTELACSASRHFSFCPAISDSEYQFLREQAKAGQLNSEQRARLDNYTDKLTAKIYAKLNKYEVQPEVGVGTWEVIKSTLSGGSDREKDALNLIAEGDISKGLSIFEKSAKETELQSQNEWRRLGIIAFGLDTSTAIRAFEKLHSIEQATIEDTIALSTLYQKSGNLEKALTVTKEKLDTLSSNEDRGRSNLLVEISRVYIARGELSLAEEYQSRAEEIKERLASKAPESILLQHDLSVLYSNMGALQEVKQSPANAEKHYENVLNLVKRLVDKGHNSDKYKLKLAVAYGMLGNSYLFQNRLGKAKGTFHQSLTIFEEGTGKASKSNDWQYNLSSLYTSLAKLHFKKEQFSDAITYLKKSLNILEKLTASDPNNARWQVALAASYSVFGEVHIKRRKYIAAQRRTHQAIDIFEMLVNRDPSNHINLWKLSNTYHNLAILHVAEKNLVLAKQYLVETRKIQSQLSKSGLMGNSLSREIVLSGAQLRAINRLLWEQDGEIARSMNFFDFWHETEQSGMPQREVLVISDYSREAVTLLEYFMMASLYSHMDKQSSMLAELKTAKDMLKKYREANPEDLTAEALFNKLAKHIEENQPKVTL